jgi:hypothetical protein
VTTRSPRADRRSSDMKVLYSSQMEPGKHTFRTSMDKIIDDPRSRELAKHHRTAPKTFAPSLCFVQGLPGSEKVREVELEQAKAKAHVSKLVHRRRRISDLVTSSSPEAAQPPTKPRSTTTESAQRTLRPKLDRAPSQSGLSIYTASGGLRVDPFFATPFATDRKVAEVLDWYRTAVVTRLDLFARVFNTTPWLPYQVPELSQSEMFFHASFATIGLMFDRRSDVTTTPSRLVLSHRGTALHLLRDQLTNGALSLSSALFCTIVFLAIFEVRTFRTTLMKTTLIAIADHPWQCR